MLFIYRWSHVVGLGALACLAYGGVELRHAVRSSPAPVTTDLVRLERIAGPGMQAMDDEILRIMQDKLR